MDGQLSKYWTHSYVLPHEVCCHFFKQGRMGSVNCEFFFFFKDFIYLFLDRGEGREKERERNDNVWLPLVCPLLGTLQPRHVP